MPLVIPKPGATFGFLTKAGRAQLRAHRRRQFLATTNPSTWTGESGALLIPKPGEVCPALAREPFVAVEYAYPGTGKTPATCILPDVFYVDLQLGSRYCSVRRVAVSNYHEFVEAAEYWRTNRTRFVVIDPITTLYDWAIELATDEYVAKPLGKRFGENGERTILDLTASNNRGETFAPGYRFVREAFMRLVRMFWPQVGNRLICIGHVRDAIMADIGQGEKGGKSVAEVDGKDLDIDGKLRNIFLSECDLALYGYRNALGVLKFTTQTKKNNAFVKCRCPHLLGRTFDFHTPTTVDDWRQIYPDTIAELCGPVANTQPQPVKPCDLEELLLTKQSTGSPTPPVPQTSNTKT